ncbi:hypothetical protein VHUM_00394 [Vanrija humicola]|uniref:Store-operated calcium entry-associated regulatory factor n=1 Tax=Vanrija humicola TaxID=5417 RepID=A0A7D8VD24_VANHU|nr:hypothetical protein VHUM_00394 [Vanrija humicola]
MGKHTKVPLSSIKALTLHAGRKGTARRTKPEPQLTCVAGPCRYAPDVVQCTQTGFDGTSAQWKCEADLADGVRFGALEVVCEGWSRAGDTNVLAGSCGLEYELVGAPRFPGAKVYRSQEATTAEGYTGLDYFLFAVYAAVAVWLVRKVLRGLGLFGSGGGAARRPSPRGGGSSWFPPWGGGGGGGGGGPSPPWGSPPPPYQRYPKPDPSPPAAQSSSSGPGFWSGVAAGAAGAGVYNWATRPSAARNLHDEPIPRATYTPPLTTARYDAEDAPGPSRRAAGYGGTRTR